MQDDKSRDLTLHISFDMLVCKKEGLFQFSGGREATSPMKNCVILFANQKPKRF